MDGLVEEVLARAAEELAFSVRVIGLRHLGADPADCVRCVRSLSESLDAAGAMDKSDFLCQSKPLSDHWRSARKPRSVESGSLSARSPAIGDYSRVCATSCQRKKRSLKGDGPLQGRGTPGPERGKRPPDSGDIRRHGAPVLAEIIA